MRTIYLSFALVLAACGSDGSNDPPASSDTDASADASADAAPETGADSSDSTPDVAAPETSGEDVAETGPDPSAVCAELGLPSVPFTEASVDDALYSIAADVTVPTTEGDWSLKERWSGCDVYLFIQDVPRQAKGWPVGLWERDVDALFTTSPRNVHYFFLPTSEDDEQIAASLDGLRGKVDAALAGMSSEDQTWWAERVHYVTKTAKLLDGWLGAIMTSPSWGAGIDRRQRIRYIGSYADPRRFDSAEQWFAPNLSMVTNEATYFNFEADREAALDATDTVVPVFDAATGVALTADVALPDAAEMAEFDTLELDLSLGCEGDGEYGSCPAWDRIVTLYLCDVVDPEDCSVEIGRWITTYHREGRWVHDVSGLLPLLADGGTRRFRFDEQDPWEVTLRFRLSNQGKSQRAVRTIPLFESDADDGFDEAYNDLHDLLTIDIPATAQRVEIASVITGHGMSMPGNCAEFCNTTHHFVVNGDEYVKSFSGAGSMFGCMNQTASGTVPNQYGTWWYGRAGWCPGKEVPLEAIDVTSSVTPGAAATFDLEAYFAGSAYTGDNWRFIQHRSWLVIYE